MRPAIRLPRSLSISLLLLMALLLPSGHGLARQGASAVPSVPTLSIALASIQDSSFVILTDSLVFGKVRIDTCRLDSFEIRHVGKERRVTRGYTFEPKTDLFSVDTLLQTLSFPQGEETRSIKVRFCPTDTVGEQRVKLIVDYGDSAGILGADTILLVGSGLPRNSGGVVERTIRFDSASHVDISSVSFGSVPAGSGRGAWIDLINAGTTSVAGALRIVKANAGFSIDSVMQQGKVRHTTDTLLPVTLQARDSAQIYVRFSSTVVGLYSAQLIFVGDSTTDSVLLSATAVQPKITLPDTINAGNVDADTCVTFYCIITNPGNTPLVINELSVKDSHFRLTKVPPAGGDTISSQGSITYPIEFCPDSAGQFSAILIIRSNASVNGSTVLLRGTGMRGTLVVDTVRTAEVVSDCDTLEVVLRNTNDTASISASLAGFAFGDRGFELIKLGDVKSWKIPPLDSVVIPVIFCSGSTLLAIDTLHIQSGDGTTIPVLLRGLKVDASIVALRYSSDSVLIQIDFGAVPTGQQRNATVYIQNPGNVPVRLESSMLLPTMLKNNGGGVVSVRFARDGELSAVIAPNGRDSIIVTYDSRNAGIDSGVIHVGGKAELSTGGLLDVSTTFAVVANGSELPERAVWLGDASGTVGETLSVAIHVSPALSLIDGIDRFRLHFRYDSTSLYPLGADDSTIAMTREKGVITVDRSGGALLTGETLGVLRFLPLSTAKSITLLELSDSITLEEKLAARRSAAATITLAGCDLGRTPAFDLKITVGGVAIGQADDAATITYQAPEGRSPRVRLVDVNGATCLSFDLPAGTGSEQTVQVPIGRISPGLYLLELRLDGDRSAVPIMVTR